MLAYRCYYDGTIYYNLTICTKKSLMTDLGLIDRLDRAHHYERLIYESYIANGNFSLSTAQRSAAFAEYKKFRP